ncbi:hypothetical protein TRIP_B40214 [uncultured Desulfatiglans sp.]|nr:hypothetical protein TRIP_B40214 [uncultured Desulfatiglans sp.]
MAASASGVLEGVPEASAYFLLKSFLDHPIMTYARGDAIRFAQMFALPEEPGAESWRAGVTRVAKPKGME